MNLVPGSFFNEERFRELGHIASSGPTPIAKVSKGAVLQRMRSRQCHGGGVTSV